jgi:hypothetical protein
LNDSLLFSLIGSKSLQTVDGLTADDITNFELGDVFGIQNLKLLVLIYYKIKARY